MKGESLAKFRDKEIIIAPPGHNYLKGVNWGLARVLRREKNGVTR
jgi:hypothetical protein